MCLNLNCLYRPQKKAHLVFLALIYVLLTKHANWKCRTDRHIHTYTHKHHMIVSSLHSFNWRKSLRHSWIQISMQMQKKALINLIKSSTYKRLKTIGILLLNTMKARFHWFHIVSLHKKYVNEAGLIEQLHYGALLSQKLIGGTSLSKRMHQPPNPLP